MSRYATVHIEPDGGEPYDVAVIARDVLIWERTTPGASVAKLVANQQMGDIYKLAWLAAKREGRFAGSQAEFEASCDIENRANPDEGEADPTSPAH